MFVLSYGIGLRSDVQQINVLCKVCLKTIATWCGSTTNLFQHLRQNHSVEWEEYVQLHNADASSCPTPKTSSKRQYTIATEFSNVIPYNKSLRWKEIYHIAKYMIPIYTVEKAGFKKLLNTIDPKCQLPSRKYFAEEALPRLYIATCERAVVGIKYSIYHTWVKVIYKWSTCV